MIVSTLMNVILVVAIVEVWNWPPSNVDIEFRKKRPLITKQHLELLRSLPPKPLMDALLAHNDSYIDSVDETDEGIVVTIADIAHLRNLTAYSKGHIVHKTITMDGVGPTLVCDEEMKTQILYQLDGTEIWYEEGIPTTNHSQTATSSNQKVELTGNPGGNF